MGATFSRVKNWTAEVLSSTDLNAEIDNILNNLGPAGVDDYSTNAAQMKLQTDPGAQGTESLATALSGEIERLRYVIQRIIGSDVTYWYEVPTTSLSSLSLTIGGGLATNRIISGKSSTASSMPLYLDPHGTNNTLVLDAAPTSFVYVIQGTQYTLTADVTLSNLVAAPSSNNTAALNNAGFTDEIATKLAGEYGSYLQYTSAGTEISNLDGKIAAFSLNNGSATEYLIGRVDHGSLRLVDVKRGFFFNSSQAAVPRAVFTTGDSLTLLKLTWIYIKTDGTLAVSYTNPFVQDDQPGSPAVGDYWFDTSADQWKYFDSATWINSSATFCGWSIQNSATACIGARAEDYFRDHNELNTVELAHVGNTIIRTKKRNDTIKVYGSTVRFKNAYNTWDITADLESGVTESASTTYYAYVTEDGDKVLSDIAPHDRTGDLLGFYHPHEAWRYVGLIDNNGSSNFDSATLRNAPENQRADVKVQITASTTWSIRPGLKSLNVEVQGAGGGAGGAVSSGGSNADVAATGGGGSGAFATKLLTIGWQAFETVSVGLAGGGGANTGANGTAGGASAFGLHAIVSGGGASSGLTAASTTEDSQSTDPGTGGNVTAGDTQIPGGIGHFGLALSGSGTERGFGGNGADSQYGRGGGGATANAGGNNGVGYGSGGGGACDTGDSGRAGGNGAPGIVFVWERY